MVRYLMLLTAVVLSGCSRLDIAEFAAGTPPLALEEYFAGNTKAYGLFQDRSGQVKRSFVVDIDGHWDGTTLTLNEAFVYNDGEHEKRVWTIHKTADGGWEGRADGVVGIAIGRGAGNTFNWRYEFDLKTEQSVIRLRFNDWLFLQPDGVMINRAYVSKFGITVGEVILTFVKQPAAAAVPAT